MRPLTTAELLNVWEQSAGRSLPEKALLLLDIACADGEPEDPALLSIGARDAKMLQLREWIFGPQLINVTSCPDCSESIEWVNNIRDLRYPNDKENAPAFFQMEMEDYQIQFRLPNSYDLAKISTGQDPRKLLTDCVLSARKNTSDCDATELPALVLDMMDENMEREDPQANILMNLNCPACSHGWDAQFDIVAYLWAEIDNWAKHVLYDITVLASAFGWSESQILNLSPKRRKMYIDIVRQ